MSTARKKDVAPEPEVFSKLLTKKEGAERIAGGVRHLHSSEKGKGTADTKATQEALKDGSVPTYEWERTKTKEFRIASSAERYDLIARLVGDAKLRTKRVLRERLEIVLEELLTNSLYHAYRSDAGQEKYARKEAVRLIAPRETLTVRYGADDTGIFLLVQDCGGSLHFKDIAAALARCYSGPKGDQIEMKDSGAGLGLYMVYDSATHLKVVCQPGVSTTISVWISDKKTYDPDTFSFNYFGGKPRD